uniref:Taste receptor type 2 n=1 Tax=Pyxicephalus adspersus TaxID=30357 RepID=A0AAV3AEP5_PYXAD|nr:TPA: hypothetical protein GDO54_009822 [Pyxicephalus adspersus]
MEFAGSPRVCVGFLRYSNLWIITVLSMSSCIKITSCNGPLIVFIQNRISRLVPHMMAASHFPGLQPPLWFPSSWLVQLQNPTSAAMNNVTTHNAWIINDRNHLTMFLLPSSLPFIIFCVAIILLIHSLWMHSIWMRSSGTGFRNPDLEVHVNVVKSMILFLFCHLLYFMSICLVFVSAGSQPKESPLRVLISVVMNAPPLLHSAFIITSNPRLKEMCLKM